MLVPWISPGIKVAAAGLGAAAAGPVGGLVGGLLGEAVGGPAAEMIAQYAEKFAEKAGEKLLEMGGDSLGERLRGEAPELAAVYREALRRSLAAVRPEVEGEFGLSFEDWFVHWEACLAGRAPLRLEALRVEQLVPDGMDAILTSTLVRLDGLGAMPRGAVTFRERALPEALLAGLRERLPALLKESFAALIVLPEYAAAWKRAELAFQAESLRLQRSIQEDTAAMRGRR